VRVVYLLEGLKDEHVHKAKLKSACYATNESRDMRDKRAVRYSGTVQLYKRAPKYRVQYKEST